MDIYFSSATAQAYENQEKTMDLFYNPIVIFESSELIIHEIKTAKWQIESETIGSYDFEILTAKVPAIKTSENRSYVEFRLSKKEVPFSHDNYTCKLIFSATVETTTGEEVVLNHEVLGVVKSKWSKNLI